MTRTDQAATATPKPRKHWSGVAGCWCCYSHSIAEAFGLNYPELAGAFGPGETIVNVITGQVTGAA